METLKALLTRTSNPYLTDPPPSQEQMDIVYNCSFRVPDHAWLRPWRFIEIKKNGRKKLAKILLNCANKKGHVSEDLKKKISLMPFRAPMIIVLIAEITDRRNIPPIEQIQSTAAAAQNILIALHDMGFSAFWRTGNFVSHSNEYIAEELGLNKFSEVLGYLYIGTHNAKEKKIPKLNKENFVTVWN